jgi:hypothetical protein
VTSPVATHNLRKTTAISPEKWLENIIWKHENGFRVSVYSLRQQKKNHKDQGKQIILYSWLLPDDESDEERNAILWRRDAGRKDETKRLQKAIISRERKGKNVNRLTS